MENNNTNYDYATPQFAESYTGSNEDFDYFEEVDLDSIEFEADGLSEMDTLRIEIDDELEQTLQEMEELEKGLEEGDIEGLASLCKTTVLNSIKEQFGIAGLLIKADEKEYEIRKDKYNRYEYDRSKNSQGRKFDGDVGTEFTLKQMDDDGMVYDAYTKGNEKVKASSTSPDHIGAVNKFHNEGGYMFQYEKPGDDVKGPKRWYAEAMHKILPKEQKADFATDKDNLALTDRKLNSSLRADDKIEYYDKKAGTYVTKEGRIIELDRDKMVAADAKGDEIIEKHLPNTGQRAAYYTDNFLKHELKPMGKKVAKSTLSSLFGQIFSDFAIAIIDEIKTTFRERGQGKTWTEIFNRFKERMEAVLKNIQVKWKDIVKNMRDAGATTALSHILGYIAGVGKGILKSVAGVLVKWLHVVFAGFKSIVKAVKVLINPPPGMSKEEVHFAAAKVFVTGLIGTVSLGFSTTIDTFLKANVPFLNVPPLSLISDAISSTIAVFIGGVLSTVVIYYMDKFHARNQKDKLQIQLVNKSGQVVQLRVTQAWFAVSDANLSVQQTANTLLEAKYHAVNMVTDSFKIQAELDAYIDETDKYVEELFNF